jgi:hypothetical protein
MRFQLSANASEVLRVIPEIPSFRLGLIEGRNGIGKSLAVRLLQLATGDQPFGSLPAAWKSLRSELDNVEILMTDLNGAAEIRCQLTTSSWPDLPSQPEDWIGNYWIDGSHADLHEVRRLVRVLRVAGDESLADTIAMRIRADRGLLSRWAGQMEASAGSLDSRFGALAGRILAARPAELLSAMDELPRLEAAHSSARDVASQLGRRVSELERAVDLARRVRGLDTEAPELRERISLLDSQVKNLSERVSLLESERSALQTQAAREDEVRKRLDGLERLLSRDAQGVASAQARMESLASDLDVAPIDEAVAAATEAARLRMAEHARERTELDATPRLKALTSSIAAQLDQADADGLGGLPLARLDSGDSLSIVELRNGIRAVRADLDQRPPVGGVARINKQIADLRIRIDQLELLQRRVVRYRNALARLNERQDAMAALATALDPATSARFTEISDELRHLSAEQIQAHVDRARLVGQLNQLAGGDSVDELRARSHRATQVTGITEEDLPAALETALSDLRECEADVSALEDRIGAMRATLEAARVEVGSLVRHLSRSAEYRWLAGDQLAGVLPSERSSERTQATRLLALSTRLDRGRDRLQSARSAVLSLQDPLEELAMSVERGRLMAATQIPEYRKRFERLSDLYSRDLGQLLNQPAIAEALFEGGAFQSLDLVGQTVSWRIANGDVKSRPLEAFSSGERAFAYTLARLESFRGVDAKNRIIALDEFGAYIASDRLHRLVTFIESKVLGEIADQVVIMLPLRQDYESTLAATTGSLHRENQARADAVTARGYVAEDLVAASA